jgi:uncharacterized protein YecT (DUF1311 family)
LNREDIIRMAREVGGADISINGWTSWVGTQSTEYLERFAALVAKHTLANIDPSSFMTWQEGYEAGKQDGKCKYCTDGCPACDARKLPEQKSVAMADYMALTEKYVALKAAQRTWVGLTDEEVEDFVSALWPLAEKPVSDRLRAIEAKLKEKNT